MVTVSGNSNPTNPTYPTNPTNPTFPTTINSGELTDKNPLLFLEYCSPNLSLRATWERFQRPTR